MQEPLLHRRDIPFFHNKTEQEIQQDPYERFDPMVLRQSALHLADDLWGSYPMQPIIDFSKIIPSTSPLKNIVEIGCGVGRWIAQWAKEFPNANCWGMDYSYQMLKRANEVWIKGDLIQLNLSRYGLPSNYQIEKTALNNLHFGLAKAATLPFDDQSQDLVVSSFLLDRLDDPIAGLKEMKRILKPDGRILMISPLNFSRAKHWETFHPPIKIYKTLVDLGFKILDWQEDILIEEPLDLRGNSVNWKCIGVALGNSGYPPS